MLHLNESREGCFRKGRGRSFHADGSKTEKAREPTVESGARNLEAENIRSRAESTGGCVKLKTVTKINTAPDTFIAENIYRLLNSLLDWELVEKLKQRCDVVSCTFFQYEASSTVLYATKKKKQAGQKG